MNIQSHRVFSLPAELHRRSLLVQVAHSLHRRHHPVLNDLRDRRLCETLLDVSSAGIR